MHAVTVEAVRKRFGDTEALAGVDLTVAPGEVLGLLGPNGAGKTTLVRVLATLLPPSEGTARIFGHDVVRDAATVRRLIGLTGQYAAVDELLTGRENLRMFGELFHLPVRTARQRADDLLERFQLSDAADRPARTYSGGMRRRLDLASSLLVDPQLLFLDEPTTGLDPRSRNAIWEITRELVAEGTTLLLTTQYLEEADQLADRIAVIDHGRIIAQGTGDQLKAQVGGQVVDVALVDEAAVVHALELLPDAERVTDARAVRVPITEVGALTQLAQIAQVLADHDVDVRDLGLRRPTLDDVFLELTGKAPPGDPAGDADAADPAAGDGDGAPAGDGDGAPPGDGEAARAEGADDAEVADRDASAEQTDDAEVADRDASAPSRATDEDRDPTDPEVAA